MPLTRDEFLQMINASGLMGAEVVASFLVSFPEDKQPADGEALARELVKQRKLTKFQAEQIYAGKGKSLVLGNYVLLDKLGQGGMGMVLKAEHKRLKRLVAIKVMSPAAVKTPDALKRFHREVEAAAKLRHPNVVATDDADEAKGIHFLVMEYVEGSDLSALVKKQGPLSIEKAVACITQAARGLEFAHQQGVIHRDIKPANLLVDTKGTVKILDMGLARIEGETGGQAELTSTGAVMGTVDYMAPEQALNTKTADARSDIYSLGISLWYLLTGKCAYEGDSLMAKLLAHRDAPIPSLSSVRVEVPAAVEAVFRKMVSKQAKDRYQTMTEVIKDLEGCLSGSASSVQVNLPQATNDSQFNAFLNTLDTSPGASAAVTKSRLSKAPSTVADSASEATLLTGDMTQPTDPQTMTSFGSQADRKGTAKQKPGQRRAATSVWWRDRRVHVGGGAVVLLMGLIWFLIPPRQDSATNSSSKQKIQSTETAKTGTSKDAAEKKALDWLFSVGAKVVVGPPGGGEQVHSTAEALASGKPVGYLEIDQRPISDKDLMHLPTLPAIYSLTLRGCEIGDKGMVSIGGLPQLTWLDLYGAKITDRGLIPLLNCFSLATLRLRGTSVTSEGLATISQLSKLTDLELSVLPITSQSLTQLQKLRSLRHLSLSACLQLTDECGAVLAQMPALETLDLSGTPIGDRAVLDLSKSRSLRLLSFYGCLKLTDECGAALAQMPELQSLNVYSTQLGDRAIQDLSKLQNLKTLSFDATQVTDAAIPTLSQMKSLTLLSITQTKFTADGVKQLAKAMPWCEIQSDHGVFKATEAVSALTVAALEFDGVGSRVELPVIPLTPSDPLTVEAWFTVQPGPKPNATDVDANLDAVWSMVNPVTKSLAHFLLDRPNESWWFGAGTERLTRTAYYSFTKVDKRTDLYGARHHAAFVRDGDEVRIYVDGQPQRSGGYVVDADKTPPDPSVRPSEVETFFLGASVGRDGKNLARFFLGSLDEFRMSKTVRYSSPFVPEQEFPTDKETLALYHFDEGSGEVLKDSSGNNHHGKIVGAKWVKVELPPSPPDFELAFEFGKSDQRVTIPLDSLDPNRPWTVEGYVQPVDQPDHNHALLAIFEGDSWHLNLNHWSMRLVEHAPKGQAQTEHVIAEQNLPRGKRVHVAGVFDGKTARLLIDGKLVGTADSTLLPKQSPKDLILGARYSGTMDEWRISKVARYEADFTPPKRYESDADTLALYHFDEGTGDVLKDSSGNNHHGQIVGAKWVKFDGSPITSDANVVYLDDLPETLWEGFSELGKRGYWLGKPSIERNGIHVPHALFTAPGADDRAVVEYDLSRRYELFQATVYLLREPTGGPQTFRVLVDGKLLWESAPQSKPNVETPVSVSARNAQRLRLEVVGPRSYSMPVWLAPRLTPAVDSKLNAGLPQPPPAKSPFDAQQARAHQEAWAKHLGTTAETTNSVGAKLILIPPGEFLMGSTDEQVDAAVKLAEAAGAEPHPINRIRKSEQPQHRAVVEHPFRLGSTEVTIAEFRAFVTDTGHVTDAERFGSGNSSTQAAAGDTTDAKKQPTWKVPGYSVNETFPVTQVSWNDAQAYCQWLSQKDMATYRLPTETEWEFACRAGTTTPYSFGNDVAAFDQHGWHQGNSFSNCQKVGTKKPNALGLFDMLGNLEEWCSTEFDEAAYSKKSSDALPAATGKSSHVVRGGHWYNSAAFGRSAFRGSGSATLRFNTLGFRVAQTIVPQPPAANAPFDAKPH